LNFFRSTICYFRSTIWINLL